MKLISWILISSCLFALIWCVSGQWGGDSGQSNGSGISRWDTGGWDTSVFAKGPSGENIYYEVQARDVLDKIPMEEIQAIDVLDKIRMNQSAEFDHVIIKGDLNLSQLGLCNVYFKQPVKNNHVRDQNSFPYYRGDSSGVFYLGPVSCMRTERDKAKLVFSPIKICNSTIEGNIDFSNTIFLKSIDFENTQIRGNITFDDQRCSYMESIFIEAANFRRSQFNGTADFGGSYFNETANFEKSKFNGAADFGYSIFKNGTLFSNSQFNRGSFFDNSEFHEGTSFVGSQFTGNTFFDYSRFMKYTDFSNTEFSGIADFKGCNFTKKADFTRTNFNDIVYFIESEFKDDVLFWDSYYRKPAYFVESQFDKNADFGDARFNQGADFRESKFNGGIYLGNTKFMGFLNLTRTKFGILDIYWPDNTLLVCDDGPTYLNLIQNFRKLEHYDVADNIYFQYREWRQNQRTWSEREKLLDILALYTCGYGVRMDYTIFSSIIILIAFGFIYLGRSWSGGITDSSFLQKVNESFWFSAIILLSAPKELYPLETRTYETYAEKIKYFTIIERFIGWGLLIILISGRNEIT